MRDAAVAASRRRSERVRREREGALRRRRRQVGNVADDDLLARLDGGYGSDADAERAVRRAKPDLRGVGRAAVVDHRGAWAERLLAQQRKRVAGHDVQKPARLLGRLARCRGCLAQRSDCLRLLGVGRSLDR